MQVTHMDAYTILFQARETVERREAIEALIKETSGRDVETFVSDIDHNANEIRQIALTGLEEGIQVIRWEYPPSVVKRMCKYYNQNKEELINTFSDNVREVIIRFAMTNN